MSRRTVTGIAWVYFSSSVIGVGVNPEWNRSKWNGMNRTVVFFAETKVGHGHVTVCAGEFIWRFSFFEVCGMFSVAFMSIQQPLHPLGHSGCTCTKN